MAPTPQGPDHPDPANDDEILAWLERIQAQVTELIAARRSPADARRGVAQDPGPTPEDFEIPMETEPFTPEAPAAGDAVRPAGVYDRFARELARRRPDGGRAYWPEPMTREEMERARTQIDDQRNRPGGVNVFVRDRTRERALQFADSKGVEGRRTPDEGKLWVAFEFEVEHE